MGITLAYPGKQNAIWTGGRSQGGSELVLGVAEVGKMYFKEAERGHE